MRTPLAVLCLLVLVALPLMAQQTAKPDSTAPTFGWKNSLVAGLTLTQVAFTDWTQGGENALAYTASADGKAEDDEQSTNWTNVYKLAFGQARLGSQGIRKTDDIIDLSSVFTYKLGTFINPYASATLKTQFAKGFTYDATGISTEVSKFFDPAYLTQSMGFGYQPVTEVKTRLGVGLREIITQDFNKYADGNKTLVNGGLESVTTVEWKLQENLLFASQLELFSPFQKMDEIVVRGTATLTAKMTKYLTTVASVQMINERRITPRTQIKETIALGVSYAVF